MIALRKPPEPVGPRVPVKFVTLDGLVWTRHLAKSRRRREIVNTRVTSPQAVSAQARKELLG